MKKYLPIILLIVGILLFVVVFFVVRSRNNSKDVNEDDESTMVEVPLDKRPVLSLTPTADGHYLKLKVDKIVIDVDSVDYELLYQTSADITQGTSGVKELSGAKSFETDLLLGTESSGKFRYDDGVETGSIELKFRKNGKLYTKFKTDFHIQKDTTELTSSDGKITYQLEKEMVDIFFLTMHTVGTPDGDLESVTYKDGYGVFASDSSLYSK